MKWNGCLFAFLILLEIPAAAWAGQIEGRITNAQGAVVSGVKVTVVHQGDGARWEATTKSDGSYAVAGLEPGAYTITVAAAPGQTPLRREVSLGAGANSVRADFQLPAAQQSVAGAE